VFCKVDRFGVLQHFESGANLADFFRDGFSETILIAEKYARCTNQVYPDGGSFWAYAQSGSLAEPKHPGFAISWTSYSIGPQSKFQHRPSPFLGNCDPTRAATAHHGGIQVCMADGSVRQIGPTVSGNTWWALCTPASGDVPGLDW
jgi:hypothetical protein